VKDPTTGRANFGASLGAEAFVAHSRPAVGKMLGRIVTGYLEVLDRVHWDSRARISEQLRRSEGSDSICASILRQAYITVAWSFSKR
jgi:hypothetical protein